MFNWGHDPLYFRYLDILSQKQTHFSVGLFLGL